MELDERYATTVVGVAGGYPGSYAKGRKIEGLELDRFATVFQAGTKQSGEETLTNGGRVIAVTGMDDDLNGALSKAYDGINSINWEDMNYRKDIGQDILALM